MAKVGWASGDGGGGGTDKWHQATFKVPLNNHNATWDKGEEGSPRGVGVG